MQARFVFSSSLVLDMYCERVRAKSICLDRAGMIADDEEVIVFTGLDQLCLKIGTSVEAQFRECASSGGDRETDSDSNRKARR